MTTSTIAKILEMLNDKQWHTLREIQQKMKLNENQILQIIKFLKEYSFIIVNEETKEIKLEKTVPKFLTQNTTS